jgi:hypothetical protein
MKPTASEALPTAWSLTTRRGAGRRGQQNPGFIPSNYKGRHVLLWRTPFLFPHPTRSKPPLLCSANTGKSSSTKLKASVVSIQKRREKGTEGGKLPFLLSCLSTPQKIIFSLLWSQK